MAQRRTELVEMVDFRVFHVMQRSAGILDSERETKRSEEKHARAEKFRIWFARGYRLRLLEFSESLQPPTKRPSFRSTETSCRNKFKRFRFNCTAVSVSPFVSSRTGWESNETERTEEQGCLTYFTLIVANFPLVQSIVT